MRLAKKCPRRSDLLNLSSSPQGLDTLLPVARETAQDRVYHQLRHALICGEFDAGAPFVVGDLAQRLSVSSMPVREALSRLVSERALEATPNRRMRIPLLSRIRARDIVAARTMIEGALACGALPRLTLRDITDLARQIDRYEDAPDASAHAAANHAFHFAIYARADMPVLLPFAESLWMQAGPYVRAAVRLHSDLVDSAGNLHHRGMLDAIRSRDADALNVELTADISRAFDILERAGDDVWSDDV